MSLREAQQAIAGWIRAPEGVAAALAEEDAAAGSDVRDIATRRLEDLIRSDAVLGAVGRLEIYANAYFHRILGVLAADYPALEKALGAESFHDLVTSYLLVEPSRQPSLRHVGTRLTNFIASHRAAAGIRARSPWAANLAALESARIDVFDVADGSVLARQSLIGMAPKEFGSLRLFLGPWVLLRVFEYPVDRIWSSATRGEKHDSDRAAARTSVLVWRNQETVLHRRLESREEAALLLVGRGISFEGLCEWTAEQIGEAEAPAETSGWLERWVGDGLLVGSNETP